MDHALLLQRLCSIGLSDQAVCWFKNYLSGRSQCVQAEGITSSSLNVSKGVPPGSVLGPLLFTIYINSLDHKAPNANFHFYADDTVIYCSASIPNQALCQLQTAFNTVQRNPCDLKLVLNADKTKLMLFTKAKSKPSDLPPITTLQGSVIESVSQYKYLGIIIDDSLSFKPHIQQREKTKDKIRFLLLETSLVFLLKPKKDLLLQRLCLCWTMVMFYI